MEAYEWMCSDLLIVFRRFVLRFRHSTWLRCRWMETKKNYRFSRLSENFSTRLWFPLARSHCVIMLNGRWGTHSGNFVVRLLSSLYIHKPSVGPMKSQSLWLLALKHWILLCVYVFVTIRLSTLHIRHSNVKIFSMLHTLVSHAASIRRSCHLHINEKP